MRQSFPRALRTPRVWICVFFAAFLLLGALTTADYGQPWDELDEMAILRMNLWEYARALGLDEGVFVPRATNNELTINALVPISQSVERDHGIAAFYPLASVVLGERFSSHTRMLLWHGWCWVIFTLGAFALYAVARELNLPRAAALLAPVFLLASPRFFAEGHYNGKDIVLLALTACVLWQGLRLARKPSYACALAFAVFGALAANTKVAGFALWGLCALYTLARLILDKRLNGRVIRVGVFALCAFVGAYALLTPALWADPASFMRYLLEGAMDFQRWKNKLLFRGAVFDLSAQALPRYYLPYMIFAATPLWVLVLWGIGQVFALRAAFTGNTCRDRLAHALPLTLCSLLWAFPLAFAIVTRTSVYNGWRHFYFIYGPALVLAAYGAHALWKRLHTRIRLRRVLAALLACCLVLTCVGTALEHPYQYAYYQPLVWLRGEDYMELDYWNVSAQDALRKLADQTDGILRLGYADIWAQNAVEHGIATLPEPLRERFEIVKAWSDADYVLQNLTYASFSDFSPDEAMREIITIRAYGRTLVRILGGAGL